VKPTYDVIIIGAGLGGLVCAYYLTKNGKKVLIIEKEDFLGGRASSINNKGFIMDQGAPYIILLGKSMRRLFKEIQLPSEDIVTVKKRAVFINNSDEQVLDFSTLEKLSYSFYHFKLIPLKKKCNLKTLYFFYKCKHVLKDIKKDYENWKKHTKGNAREYLERFFDEEIIDLVFEPISRAFLFLPLKEVSDGMLLTVMGTFVDQSNNFYHINGGIGKIIDLLEQKIKENGGMFYKAEVKKIKRKKDHFELICKNNIKKTAYSVVNNTPLTILNAMLENYPPKLKHNLKISKYLPSVCINYALKKPIKKIKDEHLIFLVRDKDKPIIAVGELSSKNPTICPSGKGILLALFSPEYAQKIIKKDDKEILKIAEKDLADILPKYKKDILFSKVFKWDHGLSATNYDYCHSDTLIKTDFPGLFLVGDHLYIGLDGIVKSSTIAAKKVEEYLSLTIKKRDK
jgi:protoporphyrinogen oxidase